MTILKWLAAAALILSATACGSSNSPYGGPSYGPGAYDYNQQPPTYYSTHYTNGQPAYSGSYAYQQPPVYYGYQQPVYYAR